MVQRRAIDYLLHNCSQCSTLSFKTVSLSFCDGTQVYASSSTPPHLAQRKLKVAQYEIGHVDLKPHFEIAFINSTSCCKPELVSPMFMFLSVVLSNDSVCIPFCLCFRCPHCLSWVEFFLRVCLSLEVRLEARSVSR